MGKDTPGWIYRPSKAFDTACRIGMYFSILAAVGTSMMGLLWAFGVIHLHLHLHQLGCA
jgi:hypothetical protein